MTLLNLHSHYSILRGTPKIPELIENLHKKGYKSAALTDTGRMHGAIEFYKACLKKDIKPLLGVSLFLPKGNYAEHPRITLIAKNNSGYTSLIKIVTKASLLEVDDFTITNIKDIEKYGKDIIVIIPSINGELTYLGSKVEAKKKLKEYSKLPNLFLGISAQENIPDIEKKDTLHSELSDECNIPLVAHHTSYYLENKDSEIRDILIKIKGHLRGNFEEEVFKDADFSIPKEHILKNKLSKFKGAVENADKIAEECNIEFKFGNWIFPSPPIEGKDEEFLKDKIYKCIKDKGIKLDEELTTRLNFELDTIIKLGYAPYFLVVNDILEFARKENINSTTRGSVAGSFVSYVLGITTINPIEYKLPFERFLNSQRISAPDIDIDFPNDKRESIIEYIKNTYGKDKVSQIGTFGTFMARASVRDISRALGYSYATGDQIARYIPFGKQGAKMTIDMAMDQVPELVEMYKRDKEVKHIIDNAKLIEGNVRHVSTHAAGIVISPVVLTDHVPLQKDPQDDGKVLTQYSMDAIEDVGLLKFDILGLKNLSIIKNTVETIKKYENIDIDLDNLDVKDKKTFENISLGNTIGMFQLNGTGMTAVLKKLKPTNIRDINAMIALFRPGPIANIEKYIDRKHGKAKITYFHEKMEKFLKDSYGVLVYQEDVMFTALTMAGYTWKTVDTFRKAIGKKIPVEMEKQHKIFVDGCIEHSKLTSKRAEELWKLFDPFKGYGFNKAHAAAYGYVSYQSAFLKTHYPAYYLASTLSTRSTDIKETSLYIREAERLNIDVLRPDVNESIATFSTHKGGDGSYYIRFGLHTIKKLGVNIADAIIKERKLNGKFSDLSNFLIRMSDYIISKSSIEYLILSGALDSFEKRSVLYKNLERLVDYAKGNNNENQISLFENSPIVLDKNSDTLNNIEKLYWEKELLGFYISGHPLDEHKEKRRGLINLTEVKNFGSGTPVNIVCVINEVKQQRTKAGKLMAVLQIEDKDDSMEAACFGQTLADYEELIAPHRCVSIKGKIEKRDDLSSIVIRSISNI